MDGSRHILVVDDDKALRGLLSRLLTGNGFGVSVAHDGAAMTPTLIAVRINLIILDIMILGEDGLSICRRLRTSGTIPIIMLTAKGSEFDRVPASKWAPTTTLPNQFSTHELLARVRAVLRRAAMPVPGSPANALVDLGAAEFDVLLALVEHPQRVLTRDQLLDLAAGDVRPRRSIAPSTSPSARLRHRLEADPKEPALIKTVRSEGYILTADVTLNGAP